EGERKFPQDTDHILNDIVSLVAELLKVGKGISVSADFAGEKLRDDVGGEFAFLNAEKDAVGENRVGEAMGVADADKALAGVVHHAIGEVRGGVNGFLRCQVGQPDGERWSHLPAFAQHHVFLRKTRLLEVVGAKHDSDAGQFVG